MNPIHRRNDLLAQEIDDELIIYDQKRNKAFRLNRTAKAIWQHCDGSRGGRELAEVVSTATGSPPSESVVGLGLQELKDAGLIEVPEPINMSRRVATKRIGLAMLPLVVSLAVPTPAEAFDSPTTSGGSPQPSTGGTAPSTPAPVGSGTTPTTPAPVGSNTPTTSRLRNICCFRGARYATLDQASGPGPLGVLTGIFTRATGSTGPGSVPSVPVCNQFPNECMDLDKESCQLLLQSMRKALELIRSGACGVGGSGMEQDQRNAIDCLERECRRF